MRKTRGARRLSLALVIALIGCSTAEQPPSQRLLLVSVASGALSAPDTIDAGWTRMRVEEDGAGHIVVAFRLPSGGDGATLASFLAALDTGRTTPPPATALGGPEMGDSGEVVIDFAPGHYVLGCLRKGEDGHRHSSIGEAKVLVVRDRGKTLADAPPPSATMEMRLTDFSFAGPVQWAAGPQLIRIENSGRQDHQVRIERLHEGKTLRDWMTADDPGELVVPVGGMARLGPGAVAYLPIDAPSGDYVVYCLVPDTDSGRPHVELGMLWSVRAK